MIDAAPAARATTLTAGTHWIEALEAPAPHAATRVSTSSTARAHGTGLDWRSARPWLAVFGAWTLVALLSIAQAFAREGLGAGASMRARFLMPLASVWLWALYTPAILELGARVRGWRRALLVHTAGALATVLLDALFDHAIGYAIVGIPRRSFAANLTGKIFIDAFSYAALVGVGQALRYARLYRERLAREAALEQQLLSAEVSLLRMQLNPHFLFNTLNAAAELVHRDADAADEMITRLGALLRTSMEAFRAPMIPFAEELAFVEQYLAIMRVRLGGRLRVSIVASDEARAVMVPPMLLQPIVENALRHGIERRAGAGHVEIEARRREGVPPTLEIQVRDDGAGLDAAAPSSSGIGVRNTRERLAHLYGHAHELAIRPRLPHGVLVTISIPA